MQTFRKSSHRWRGRRRAALIPAAFLSVFLVAGYAPVATAEEGDLAVGYDEVEVVEANDPSAPDDPDSPVVELDDPPLVDGPIYEDPDDPDLTELVAASVCHTYGTATSAEAQRAIDRACSKIGTPYVLGGGHGPVPGPTKGGFDCSGLVRWAYYNPASWGDLLGSGAARDQYDRMKRYSKATIITSKASLRPGDLVYWGSGTPGGINHVSIYLGSGLHVHAANKDLGVTVGENARGTFYRGVRLSAGPTPDSIRRDRVSDFTADGKADLFGVNAAGELFLYTNTGDARFSSPRKLGHGWQNMTHVMAADWGGDGAADVLAVTADGYLRYYPNNNYALSPGVKIGHGWQNMTHIMAADWGGDGRADILAVDAAGKLWLYPHAAGNTFNKRLKIGHGWQNMTHIMAADWNHDGRADVLAVDAAGNLWVYLHTAGNGFSKPVEMGHGWDKMARVWASDVSGDGFADVMSVSASGNLMYYAHSGARLRAGVVIGPGWQDFKFVF